MATVRDWWYAIYRGLFFIMTSNVLFLLMVFLPLISMLFVQFSGICGISQLYPSFFIVCRKYYVHKVFRMA